MKFNFDLEELVLDAEVENELELDKTYVAKLIDIERTDFNGKEKYEFKYKTSNANGEEVFVNRSKVKNKFREWLETHSDFDAELTASDLIKKILAADHLILVSEYEGNLYVDKVMPLH